MQVICNTQFISIISLVDLPDMVIIGRTFLLLWNKFHCSGINLVRTNVILYAWCPPEGAKAFLQNYWVKSGFLSLLIHPI